MYTVWINSNIDFNSVTVTSCEATVVNPHLSPDLILTQPLALVLALVSHFLSKV